MTQGSDRQGSGDAAGRSADSHGGDLTAGTGGGPPEHGEAHSGAMATRLNWLRAAVLGANDGVVSTAGLVVGVAGATSSKTVILTAGLAGMFAGALAMASGEYVSVSSQRDSERALLALERRELAESPEAELAELAQLYEAKGLTPGLARQVAGQLTEHDAMAAHAEAELGIDPQQLANPWHAAGASFLSFTVGALLPLLAITLVPAAARVAVTVAAVLAALVITGATGAALGQARRGPAILRNVIGGALAMAVTYGIGSLIGAAGI
ncbi:MAG TPA: VIT family protein [Streptosporangiaceae bacterium]|nr:VIT family protein [Streptosporangiaceae bacterium]